MNRWSKDFVDTFNVAAKNLSRAQLFDDFLKISAATLRRDEKTFAEVPNKELHNKLFGKLIGALDFNISAKILRDHSLKLDYKIPFKPRYRDELGEIFHALELFDQDGGQVFTPQHIADIMGESTLTPEFVQRQLAEKGFIVIKEDCCGSGALILGGLNALLDRKINPTRFVFATAADTDIRCVLMTFIQLSLYMIPATVVQRNAVTDETYGEEFYTPIFERRKYEHHR